MCMLKRTKSSKNPITKPYLSKQKTCAKFTRLKGIGKVDAE